MLRNRPGLPVRSHHAGLRLANQDPQYASKVCTRIWRKDGHDKVREMLSEKEAQVRPGANAARGNRVGADGMRVRGGEREIGVYWYLFSNHYTRKCIHKK